MSLQHLVNFMYYMYSTYFGTVTKRITSELQEEMRGNRDYYFMRLWRCRHRYDLSHELKYRTTGRNSRLDRDVSKKRIAWTGQEIERSKWTALRLTMHRSGRAYRGFARKIEPDEQGYKVQ